MGMLGFTRARRIKAKQTAPAAAEIKSDPDDKSTWPMAKLKELALDLNIAKPWPRSKAGMVELINEVEKAAEVPETDPEE